MLNSLRTLLFILAVMAMPQALYPQSAGVSVSASIAVVAWFDRSDWIDGIAPGGSDLYFLSKGDYRKLDYQFRQIGSVKAYHGSADLVLYTRYQGIDGEWRYIPVSSCDIGAGGSVVLFMLPGEGGARFDLYPVNLSRAEVNDGGIVIVNLTQFPIAAAIHSLREAIQPGGHGTFRALSDAHLLDIPIRIALYDEAWRMVYDVSTTLTQDRPYLGVFYLKNGRLGAYRFRLFRELDILRKQSIALSVDGS